MAWCLGPGWGPSLYLLAKRWAQGHLAGSKGHMYLGSSVGDRDKRVAQSLLQIAAPGASPPALCRWPRGPCTPIVFSSLLGLSWSLQGHLSRGHCFPQSCPPCPVPPALPSLVPVPSPRPPFPGPAQPILALLPPMPSPHTLDSARWSRPGSTRTLTDVPTRTGLTATQVQTAGGPARSSDTRI